MRTAGGGATAEQLHAEARCWGGMWATRVVESRQH